mgnify:FL=1
MKNKFPRKEIYLYQSKTPLAEGKVCALNDSVLILSQKFKDYSNPKWELENKGWTSSVIPNVIQVDCKKEAMVLHCGKTEYKHLLGMVKIAKETHKIPLELINGLATEIMPITSDRCFFIEKRTPEKTQHGAGFYDIPTAGQNAEIYFKEARKKQPLLIKDIFDMNGFPKWNLIRHLNLKREEIGKIFYTGFCKGFEVSLASLFNGYAKISLKAEEVMKRTKGKEFLCYQLKDLPEILKSIGNDGKIRKIKPDIYGNVPEVNPETGGFMIVEDAFGTILGALRHIEGEKAYKQALKIIKKKGYKIIRLKQGKINLAELR